MLCLIDDFIAEKKLSYGGLKEISRIREILGNFFYYENSEYVESAINYLMGFAFKERSGNTS